MTKFTLPPLKNMLHSSSRMVLDFSLLDDELDVNKNIQKFFEVLSSNGADPKLPENRQKFNQSVFDRTDFQYLVSEYLEERSAMLEGSHIWKEGRVFHLGMDIFTAEQEAVYAVCDGEIVVSQKEPGDHGYGNYIILKPDDDSLPYVFYGHLSDELPELGLVKAGDEVGRLGHWDGYENGDWSIHLHLQLLKELPATDEAPIGYTTHYNMAKNRVNFPDPKEYFPGWAINR